MHMVKNVKQYKGQTLKSNLSVCGPHPPNPAPEAATLTRPLHTDPGISEEQPLAGSSQELLIEGKPRHCKNQPLAFPFPGLMPVPMQKGQWLPLPLQQICYFYCYIWFRPHRGEFAKVPYWGGIGAFGVPLFGSVPLRWPRLVVFSPSKSASQREVAARWEKGQRKPAPIIAIPRLQGDFGGALSSPCSSLGLPGLPEGQYSLSTFPVGIQRSQQNPWTLLGCCQQRSSLSPCRLQWHDVVFIEARLDFF